MQGINIQKTAFFWENTNNNIIEINISAMKGWASILNNKKANRITLCSPPSNTNKFSSTQIFDKPYNDKDNQQNNQYINHKAEVKHAEIETKEKPYLLDNNP